jgi:8-oxo-dGTP pyrophosphatase MutT (NUDIX family)
MNNLKFLEQIYDTDKITKKVNVAGGIIFKEQRGEKPAILLIQRAKDDHWPNFMEFPRGKCDNGPNESLIACLKREVKEETGLDIIPLKFIDKFSYTADEGTRLSTQHNYLCKMKDPNQKVKLSKEHQGFQWITTPGEAELTVLPEMKKAIIKAFEMVDPETQIVNYPENDFTPDNTIEEKNMKTSNKLVDKYLEELGLTAMGVAAATGVVQQMRGLGSDANRLKDWYEKKKAARQQQKMMKSQMKEKQKQEKMRLAMTNKPNKSNVS